MDTQTILKYVMDSPENTNPNVLKGMLDALSEGGGGSSDFSTAEVSINIIGGSTLKRVKFDGIAFLSVAPDEDTIIATDPSFYRPSSIPFVLYQGHAHAELIPPENFTITNVSTEGDVSVNDNVYADIRGNGSITITITAD